jgi:hypothetical protein
VTEPAELTHDVLLRVAEFIRKLPADQIAELGRGDARLEVVPKGARIVAASGAGAAKDKAALPRPANEIEATMSGIGDRVAARRYLEVDLKLTLAQLKALAGALNITVRGTKPRALDDLVEWAVGRRLDSEVIGRAGVR